VGRLFWGSRGPRTARKLCCLISCKHEPDPVLSTEPTMRLLFDIGVLTLFQISTLDFKTSEFVSIHSKPIRDLAFHSRTSDATMLSCSMDKTVKLTSLHSNNILQTLVLWRFSHLLFKQLCSLENIFSSFFLHYAVFNFSGKRFISKVVDEWCYLVSLSSTITVSFCEKWEGVAITAPDLTVILTLALNPNPISVPTAQPCFCP